MTQSGRTPPTRKDRRAQERAAGKTSSASTAPQPAWKSPVALISLAVVVVGVVIVAQLALNSSKPAGAAIKMPPGSIAAYLRDGRSLGSADAPVVIDVYEDPQCPVCGRFSLDREPLLISEYVKIGLVRLTYRDFVFIGAESLDAAVGMRAADQLAGKFWDYNAIVFENQDGENLGAFSRERLGLMAEKIGLDKAAFTALLDDAALIAAVNEETAGGQALGINQTPTLVVNGVVKPGLPTWEDLQAMVEAALAAASPAPSGSPAASAAPLASAAPVASAGASTAP